MARQTRSKRKSNFPQRPRPSCYITDLSAISITLPLCLKCHVYCARLITVVVVYNLQYHCHWVWNTSTAMKV